MPQQGRVALVTGGAGGIGAATAHRLARDGASVAVLDLDADGAAAVAGDLPHGGLGLRCDITDPDSVAAAVGAVLQRYGRVDVLVNNAGMLRNADLLDMPGDVWAAVLAANLTGPFTVTQAVVAHMAAAGYGRIVFVTSLAALGNPGQANYAAAKAGAAGLARTVALELGARGVTSNVVAPGYVRTAMLRDGLAARGRTVTEFEAGAAGQLAVGRIGEPADIAAAVAFFALPEAGFVTGQTLYVTGHPSGG
ncbi:SDR family oxidoreductase [Modestobacter sp. I12A-02628]|uniref:SDR family oxidoreductase n=1 Tax=Goekera deserti TaxID=2497753 RepID=A0A7K3WIR3_9ACTN|nr:SDR family oxidoreductase [Goekera deserti]MPQ96488.1 SDR family oxidoreductase [Goekera deserti]NDI47197.1 SDR family oxidoreductase [Goekera deserti]NEL55403.1 SDR family oxidoreductase [Goekera deserti]